MVTKNMARSEWTRLRAKRQVILPFSHGAYRGKISLIKMLDVSEPFVRIYDERPVVLADNGYYWLQLAIEGAHAWFTVMFDDAGCLLQIYVDVTDGNETEKDDPTFDDLFLDFVVYGDRVFSLDRDELDAAYSSGEITKEQYETALDAGRRIEACLRENTEQLCSFFSARLEEMIPLLEGKQKGKTLSF